MLGYVTTEKQELKLREYEIYRGYYCGVCKSIGRRYGQLPRMALSYDAAFLAMVLAGLEEEPDQPTKEHCIIHPIKKNTTLRNEAIDYAADVMLILTWYKLLDDATDENKASSKALLALMKPIFKKLKKARGPLCDEISGHLSDLNRLEGQKSGNLDQVSETFAKILEAVLVAGPVPSGDQGQVQTTRRSLARLGYHLGKWIYLMDAWDDLEDNLKTGAYNPFLYRYGYEKDETPEMFRARIKEACEWNLLVCCGEMGKALDLLEIKKNSSIIENIVYLGLLRRTENALRKEDEKNGESL
jgi:hypothetical protein